MKAVTSFETTFNGTIDRATFLAYRVLGDWPAARDAAAEALTSAHERWPRLTGWPYRYAWIYRVAINRAIDVGRRSPAVPADARKHEVADIADEAAANVDAHRALGRLSRRQRDVIALRYLQGLSEAEVAVGAGNPSCYDPYATRASGTTSITVLP